MSHEYVLWVALAAYGIHILEEYELNWRDWARVVLRLPVEWESFHVVNALVVVLGGLGSIPGAFVGGLVIGLVQSLTLLILPLQLQNTGVFIALPRRSQSAASMPLITAKAKPERHQ